MATSNVNVFMGNGECAKKYSDYYNSCINCCGQQFSNADTYSNYIKDYINGCLSKYDNYSAADLRKNDYWKKIFDEAHKTYTGLLSPLVTDAQANADCASATEQSMINDAISARQAGINAGMGKARSGLLGDASSTTNAISTGNNAYSSSIQNQGSTQADYLIKMGQACALCNCAQNMQRGGLFNALGAVFTGAGQGMGMGASLGASMGS